MPGALDGVRVLDLSWGIAGPLGTLLLAEQGADVIKVEPPGGDPFREYSGYAVWNRSRRSVTVDLKQPAGADAFRRLAADADVLVETFRPGVTDRLGIGYDALHELNPRLVYLSCPAYPEGHRFAERPGYDALVQASSGQQWEQPGWRPGPIFLHMPMPSMGAMFLVPTGIISALIAREATGRGQHVRTSLFQGALLYTTQIWSWVPGASWTFYGTMAKTYPPGVHQEMIFEVADNKYVHSSIMSGLAPVKSQDALLGLPDPSDPEKYMMLSPEERAELTPKRRAAYKQRERDGLIAEFRENNHAIEAIESMEFALGAGGEAHPQLVANDMIATIDDPVFGPTTQVGVPIHLAGTPGAIRGPRPTPGQHNEEIFGELGYSPAEIAKFAGGGVMHALEGVRLIDFGQYLAGPFGPMVVGDLGADVIKVEPVAGDGMRMAGGPFFGCQRGKRSIAIDLKKPRGLELALLLVERADIVHHNMTAGVAKRLGIGYEDCKRVKPDLVYCNTWAYGLEGPLAHFGGLDPLYQASAGLEYEQGPVREGNAPNYLRFGMTDTANAMLSVVGCLAALYHQRVSGEGQELWTSLLDGGSMFASDAMLVDGEAVPRPRLDKGQTGTDALYRLYETQEGWLQIAAVEDKHWEALCGALAVPDLATDPRFATRGARAENRKQLETLLEPRFATRTALVWTRLLDAVGVPNEMAFDSKGGERVLFDGDNERLGLVAEYDHALFGRMRQFGSLIDFSETPGLIHGPPPLVGEHTVEILEWLGIGEADRDDLKASGVVYWPDDNYAWGV